MWFSDAQIAPGNDCTQPDPGAEAVSATPRWAGLSVYFLPSNASAMLSAWLRMRRMATSMSLKKMPSAGAMRCVGRRCRLASRRPSASVGQVLALGHDRRRASRSRCGGRGRRSPRRTRWCGRDRPAARAARCRRARCPRAAGGAGSWPAARSSRRRSRSRRRRGSGRGSPRSARVVSVPRHARAT